MEKLRSKALRLGAEDFKKSMQQNKKWAVKVKNRWIHFGDDRYQDYTQHNDQGRRQSYLARARGIKNKSGQTTWKDKNTKNYWSVHLLWDG